MNKEVEKLLDWMCGGELECVRIARDSETGAQEMAELMASEVSEYTGGDWKPSVEDCKTALLSDRALELSEIV